jgi:hypothetical protein
MWKNSSSMNDWKKIRDVNKKKAQTHTNRWRWFTSDLTLSRYGDYNWGLIVSVIALKLLRKKILMRSSSKNSIFFLWTLEKRWKKRRRNFNFNFLLYRFHYTLYIHRYKAKPRESVRTWWRAWKSAIAVGEYHQQH